MIPKNVTLENPRFINTSMTIVSVKAVNNDTGEVQRIQFNVPEEGQSNPYWDKILEEVTIEELQDKLANEIQTDSENRLFRQKQERSAQRNEVLKELFNNKTQFLNYPFAEKFTREEKRLIRKAPTMILFNIIATNLWNKYVGNEQLEAINEIIKADIDKAD